MENLVLISYYMFLCKLILPRDDNRIAFDRNLREKNSECNITMFESVF